MTDVPQIRVESSVIDVLDEATVSQTGISQSGCLSVPCVSTSHNSSHTDDHVISGHMVDEHSPQPWLGTLYITAVTKSVGKKQPIQRELVWVQLYRRYPSVGSRLGSRTAECQSYAMFYPATVGGKHVTRTSPDPCATPLLCVNLKHSTVVQLDPKRFSLVTRSGEYCSLQAEVTDDADLDYWLSVFRPDSESVQQQQQRLTLQSAYGQRMVRSAPNSPERKRRGSQLCTNGFGLDSPGLGSMEPLNDIQEVEGDE